MQVKAFTVFLANGPQRLTSVEELNHLQVLEHVARTCSYIYSLKYVVLRRTDCMTGPNLT